MKYRICYIFVLLSFLCICTCCGNGSSYADFAAIGEEDGREMGNGFPDYVYDQQKVQFLNGVPSMAIAESGYYYTMKNRLYFYNIDSDQNTLLCSRVNCGHDSADCDAFVYTCYSPVEYGGGASCNCFAKRILYYDGSLYMIERTEEGDYFLYRYNSGFGNREKVLELASLEDGQVSVSSADACVIRDGYLYYIGLVYDPDYVQKEYMGTFQCRRVKLEKDAEPEVLGEFEYGADYAWAMGESSGIRIFAVGEDIYYVAGGTGRAYTTSDPVQYRVMRYHTGSGEFTMLWFYTGTETANLWGEGTGNADRLSCGNYICMDETGNLYIMAVSDEKKNYYDELNCSTSPDSIVRFHPEKGTSEVIYTASRDYIDEMICDGEYLYFFESYEEGGCCLKAVDINGSVAAEMELEYTEAYLELFSAFEEHYRSAFPNEKIGKITVGGGNVKIYGVDERYILLACINDANVFQNLAAADMDYDSEAGEGSDIAGVGVIDKQSFLRGEDCGIRQIYQRQSTSVGSEEE